MSSRGGPENPGGAGELARTVTCPACRGPSVYGTGNPWRPFCSERCRHADLGAWASEQYRVATPPATEDPDGALPQPTRH
jgi:endogenous inhibitor of DNA gyrase (YacG/DUF329 family)